jgi:CRP-like cAMP-binding protein
VAVTGVFTNAQTKRELAAGEVVFSEGDAGAEMYGVISGSVELRHGDTVVTSVGADGTFGELSIIDQSVRSLTAVAAEPTTIAVIDKRTFLFLVHETPTFAISVMKSLADRIRQLG